MSSVSMLTLLPTLVAAVLVPYAVLWLATPTTSQTTIEECTYTRADDPGHWYPLPTLSDEAALQLTVVVPMYNEEKRLTAMLDDTLDWLESQRAQKKPLCPGPGLDVARALTEPLTTYELLLVDDGSRDGTIECALAYGKRRALKDGADIRITRLRKNRGKGAAVRHGMLHARGAFVLFADADGATRFADLSVLAREMVRVLTPAGHGIVVGSRAHLVTSEAVVKRSFLRNLLMRCFHLVLALLMHPPSLNRLWPRSFPKSATVERLPQQPDIQDTQCGFKLFARASVAHLFPLAHIDRWIFDVEILLLAQMTCRASEGTHALRPEGRRGDGSDTLLRLPLPVSEVAVHWTEVDGSKIHLLTDSMRMGRDLVVLRMNYALGRWRRPGNLYTCAARSAP